MSISYCSYACLFLMYNFTVGLELKITMSELVHDDKHAFKIAIFGHHDHLVI